MEKELEVKMDTFVAGEQRGFILVTALIMLSLLTLLSLGMYMSSRSATQTSASAQKTTEAYYYAETAINYISWALANDAEFDNFTYSGTYQAAPFGEPNVPSTAATVGDFTELKTYLWAPGPIGQAGSSAVDTNPSDYTSGQLMYFDNSPLGQRYVCMQNASNFSNCIDVTVDPAIRVAPTMENISAKLPRYIKLEISSTGVVTPSIPSLPHRNPPVASEDVPVNGAIVWLTAVDATDPDKDIDIFPLDPSGLNGGLSPSACDGGTVTTCPCTAPVLLPNGTPDPADPNYASYITAQACQILPNNTGQWLSNYGVAAYAIGYVNGKPSKLLRAVIM